MKRIGIIGLVVILGSWVSATSARAQRRHSVKVDSVPPGAAVYLETRDAGVQGHTPHTFKLQRGSYTFILEAAGHEVFSRTVQIKRKASFNFTLIQKPEPGSITVSAAAGSTTAGAAVKVNGKVVGKAPVTLTLQPGRYLIELEKEAHNPFKRWVDVKRAAKHEIVVTLTPRDPGTGTLLVSSNIMGAEVFVDGRRRDTAPALVTGLKPGKHMLEARAKGHVAARKEATVVAGQTVKVTLELKPDAQTVAKTSGTLMVLASHKGVEILVDGTSRGKAPVQVPGLVEGSHLVEAHKAGMVSAEQNVSLKNGEFKTVKLTLAERVPPRRHGAIRVVSQIRGAQVLIDGVLQGKTPLLRHQLDPGPHFVTVRHAGYQEVIKTVEVKAGQIAEMKADLVKSSAPASRPVKDGQGGKGGKDGKDGQDGKDGKGEGDKPEAEPLDTHGVFSLAATAVPPTFFTADVTLGFPHIFEGRLTTGFFTRGHLRMDGGVEFRTYGAMSEIGVHTRLRLLHLRPFSLAGFFALGGGGGPASRSTFYTKLGVAVTMLFSRRVAFTGRAYFDFYTDRHCPEESESGELDVCRGFFDEKQVPVNKEDIRKRFAGARFLLNAAIEVEVTRHLNLVGVFEGAPFQGNRVAFSDPFAEIMPETDPGVYGRIGVTLKY